MSRIRPRYRFMVVVLLLLLLFFAAIGNFALVRHLNHQLYANEAKTFRAEQDLFVSSMQDPLLRHDYSLARNMVEAFFKDHSEYTRIVLKGPNGFPLFRGIRAEMNPEEVLQALVPILIGDHVAAVLLIEKDVSFLIKDLHRVSVTVLVVSLALISLMAFALWTTIKRLGLDPLSREIDHLSQHDALTGLPNRNLFRDLAYHATTSAMRQKQCVAVMMIGLNRFKKINEGLGRVVGDQVLVEVATRLKNCVREDDIVCRSAGDEFGILLSPLKHQRDASLVAQKVLDSLTLPMKIDQIDIVLSASVGISLFPADAQDDRSLLKHADTAMYQAKKEGSNYYFFSSDLGLQVSQMLEFEDQLRKALKNKELELFYQPQFDLETRQLVGAEALLRWNSNHLGWVPPDRIIPVAEENGLIVPLGLWVIYTACEFIQRWHQKSGQWIKVAVNVSARQFQNDDFVDTVEQALQHHQVPASYLELEITESILMENLSPVLDKMEHLAEIGVPLAIDDFGTGYSSLAYLKHLPIRKLKIDRTFVTEITSVKSDLAIARSVVALADVMELDVVAEGIENLDQLLCLQQMQCGIGQGYLFSKPLSEADFVSLLTAQEMGQQMVVDA